jgi:hypothetical protein
MQLQIMCPCRDPSCKQYSTHIHGDLYSDAKQPLQHVESESITVRIVPKKRSVMAKDLRSAQQVLSSS